jgi:hypothetical protein
MTITVLLLTQFHFIIIMLAAIIVYGTTLLLLKAFDKQDRETLQELWNKLPFKPKTVDQ